MRILKFQGNSKVDIGETARPTADNRNVVIKVKASALCGSELHRFKGDISTDDTFFNAGHEVVGIVEDAPSDSPYQPGMRVGAQVVQGCGECEHCLQQNEIGCQNKIQGYSRNAHAEYYRLGLGGIHPVPDDLDWPEAAILTGDGLGVPIRCSQRLGDTSGQKVLILGLGPVGLSNVMVQSFKGAEVIGSDIFPYRINHAKTLGAVQAHHPDDLKPEVLEWTHGKGADVVILAVGNNNALLQAVDLVKYRGTIFQVGEMREASFSPSSVFIRKEVTWTGSWYYTNADWDAMLAIQQAGLPLDKFITHTFPFEQAQQAYDTFISGESGKVVLTYD